MMQAALAIIGWLGCRLLVILGLAALMLWLGIELAGASPRRIDEEAPSIVFPADPIAFRNVVETGDLFLVYRYQLPASGSWDQYGVSGALSRVIDTAPPSVQDAQPPDIGHALMAHYLEAGHGLTWSSSNNFVRLQGNPALFESVSAQDRTLDYTATGADSATLLTASTSRQTNLCDVFKDLLQGVEVADSSLSAGDLVSGGIMTAAGTAMATAAFTGAATVLPSCFTVGVEGSGNAFDPPSGALRSGMVGDVEATSFWTSWRTLATSWGWTTNTQAALAATMMIVGASLTLTIILTAITGPVFSVPAGVVFLLAGAMWVPHFLLQVVMVITALGVTAALMFWWQRVPR